ncbi:MAG: polysaccharide biosynthesis/export family protein [Calditrichaceae bacterium]
MKKFLPAIAILLIFSFAEAQNFDTPQEAIGQFSDRPAQYILGTGDILLVNVNLWGHVQRPGIYSIPSSYTLIDLLSSAGGPMKTARLNDVRIVRKNEEVIRVNVETFLKTGNIELLPILQPGDTIIVSGSIQDVFARVVGFMRDLAIIVNVFVIASRI